MQKASALCSLLSTLSFVSGSNNRLLQGQVGLAIMNDDTTPSGGVIGGQAFYDANSDGMRDDVLPSNINAYLGVGDINVWLFSCNDPSAPINLALSTTSSNGIYRFTNLEAGRYYIVAQPPEGYKFSNTNNAGIFVDSTIDPDTGRTICFELQEGEKIMEWGFGIQPATPTNAPTDPPSSSSSSPESYWPTLSPTSSEGVPTDWTYTIQLAPPAPDSSPPPWENSVSSGMDDIKAMNEEHFAVAGEVTTYEGSDGSSDSGNGVMLIGIVGGVGAFLVLMMAILFVKQDRRRRENMSHVAGDNQIEGDIAAAPMPTSVCKPFTANDNGGEKLNTPTTTHSLSSGSPDRLVLPAAAETIVRETIETRLSYCDEEAPALIPYLSEEDAAPEVWIQLSKRQSNETDESSITYENVVFPPSSLLFPLGVDDDEEASLPIDIKVEVQAEIMRSLEQEIRTLKLALQTHPKDSQAWLLLHSYLERTRQELDTVQQDIPNDSASANFLHEEEIDNDEEMPPLHREVSFTSSNSDSVEIVPPQTLPIPLPVTPVISNVAAGAKRELRRCNSYPPNSLSIANFNMTSISRSNSLPTPPPAWSRFADLAKQEKVCSVESEFHALSAATKTYPRNSPERLLLKSYSERVGRREVELFSFQQDMNKETEPQIADITAPSGNLGLVVDKRDCGGVYIRNLHPSSPLRDQIHPNDEILAIDDFDVQDLSPVELGELLCRYGTSMQRKITIARKKDASYDLSRAEATQVCKITSSGIIEPKCEVSVQMARLIASDKEHSQELSSSKSSSLDIIEEEEEESDHQLDETSLSGRSSSAEDGAKTSTPTKIEGSSLPLADELVIAVTPSPSKDSMMDVEAATKVDVSPLPFTEELSRSIRRVGTTVADIETISSNSTPKDNTVTTMLSERAAENTESLSQPILD